MTSLGRRSSGRPLALHWVPATTPRRVAEVAVSKITRLRDSSGSRSRRRFRAGSADVGGEGFEAAFGQEGVEDCQECGAVVGGELVEVGEAVAEADLVLAGPDLAEDRVVRWRWIAYLAGCESTCA